MKMSATTAVKYKPDGNYFHSILIKWQIEYFMYRTQSSQFAELKFYYVNFDNIGYNNNKIKFVGKYSEKITRDLYVSTITSRSSNFQCVSNYETRFQTLDKSYLQTVAGKLKRINKLRYAGKCLLHFASENRQNIYISFVVFSLFPIR